MITYEMVRTKAEAAHRAAGELAVTSTVIKNKALLAMADALEAGAAKILAANAKDMEAGRANNMKESMLDRLALSQVRINAMAEGLRQVAQLEDPVGNVLDGRRLPNGLTVTKVRVPLGVIGIIYEARPNVTADAIGLCIKSGNAVILKGGSEALQSNIVIAGILTQAAESAGIPAGAIQFVDSSDRQAVTDLIKMNGLVDVVIPRGGAGLIQAVVQNATVPVIETGIGVCHTYVDAGADYSHILFRQWYRMQRFLSSKQASVSVILMWMQVQTMIWRVRLRSMLKYSVRQFAMLWKHYWCMKTLLLNFCRRC